MERIKRIVCLLLCLVMVVGIVPANVLAEEVDPLAETQASDTGNLVGGKVYTLDTNGVTADKNYLIVNTNNGDGYALTNNNGTAERTPVTISNNTITVEDDTNIAWQFSGSTSGSVGNNDRYVYPNNGSLSLNTSGTDLTISNQNNGAYRISRAGDRRTYYLRYINNAWTGSTSSGNVYLYEYTSASSGESVEFTVTPGSATLKPEDTLALTGTVTVAGTAVDLGNCTITWKSNNAEVATVSNGTVTGVADGEANIVATLSAVNGIALQTAIVLPIPVTVQSKALDKTFAPVLTGNDPITINVGETPDFSGIQLEVKYEGDEETTFITVDNGLVISEYDNNTIGSSYLTISFGGEIYGTVRLTVKGDPYAGKEDATTYPEYPADGAVRIDKNAYEEDFQNTGVVRVELDVAGVSVKPAVDVILVTDLSNSMAWVAGSRTDATSHETTKLYGLQQSVASFADIFLAADEDGSATKNTMSLVTFGGYDADHTNKVYSDYADATQTLLLGCVDASEVKSTINDIRLLADSGYSGGYRLSFDGGNTYKGNYGNTNYDHAFMQTADAIADLKAAYKTANGTEYDDSGRQIYILFMTDGAPSNYDGVYYQTKSGDRPDVNSTWIDADGDQVTYTMGSYGQDAWYEYIAGGTYNATTDTIPGNPLYWADQVYNITSVANIYGVGFDIDNGGFSGYYFTYDEGTPLEKVLQHLVTGETLEVFSADDQAGLSKIYSDLATKIRYAGTNANVTDVVDSDFNLQLTQTTGEDAINPGDLGFKPTITIKAYDLWTKEETDDSTLIGTRQKDENGEEIFESLENVTFNDDGTEAFSDMVDGGETNILSTEDGVTTISGHYFTYTCTGDSVETFEWNIGNITDKEIALSYYAYLTGTMEGTRPQGLYYTNEEAVLEYIDINEKHATKIFPIPAVAWGGASTAYEFYLVNEAGQPCDRNGNVIPFANRVIITGPYYEELYLNQEDEEKAKEIVAAYVLPAGYTLYDETAQYTVVTASGDKQGSLTISDPGYGTIGTKENYTGTRYAKVTNEDGSVSYVESETGSYKKITAQTTIVVYPTDLENEKSFIQTRVAFGVKYNEIPDEAEFSLTPDKVVIDYGKEIVINIANGNDDLEDGYTAKLVGFSKYYADVDMKQKFSSTPYTDNYKATYGIFSIENNGENGTESTVRYKPTAIVNDVEMIFCVIEMHNATGNDTYYMVDWLTVIPATSVYYETDFATGVFATSTTSETDTWQTKEDTSSEKDDNTQDDGTIGENQTYGYDSTYNDDTHLSDGDSLFVKGQGYDTANDNAAKTYTTFSFKGTGFDLISRTGAAQGLIKAEVFSDAAMTGVERTVSVLNKSESNLELYQIPVVSIDGLDYGTHYVRVSVDQSYTSTIPALSALDRGDEFYFDAIRVFDPAMGNEVAEEAYAADGEANRQPAEVRALLLSEDFYATLAGETTGALFIDRTQGNVDVGNQGQIQHDYKVETYATVGPNNETYLSNGQAVAFKLNTSTAPASFDLGAKSITGVTAGLEVTITNNAGTSWTVSKDITSSTAQNINLLENGNPAVFNGNVYVIITNTADGVLSVTDMKAAFGSIDGNNVQAQDLFAADTASVMTLSAETEAYDPYAVSYTVDAATFTVARAVLLAADAPEEEIPDETEPEETEPEVTEPEETEPEVTEPEAKPNYDILDASIKTTTGKNKKTVITVETTQDVVELKIREGKKSVKVSSIDYEDQEDGTRVWTIVLSNSNNGNKSYTITGYGEDGTSGRSASVSNKNNKNNKKNNKR